MTYNVFGATLNLALSS